VVRSGDCTAGTLILTNGPVLVEGSCSLDRRLVNASAFVDVVCRSVAGDRSLVSETARWVVGTEILEDVVFDERACRPTVDGEVAVTIRGVGTGECYGLSGSRIPSLSTDEVTIARPGETVLSCISVGVGDGGTTISPEGVIVSTAGTGGTWSTGTGEEGSFVGEWF